jgi:hypothetical protein
MRQHDAILVFVWAVAMDKGMWPQGVLGKIAGLLWNSAQEINGLQSPSV